MNKQLTELLLQQEEQLRNTELIDFATNDEIDKLLIEMVKIINNQTEILKKQEEVITAIQISSNQSSMYSIISITIAIVAVAVAISLGQH